MTDWKKYDPFPALSLGEPYGSFVAWKFKPIETRLWTTDYRGPILICTSAKPYKKHHFEGQRVLEFYRLGGRFQYGHAIAVVNLVNIEPMRVEHEEKACFPLYAGAYSWFLENIRRIEPFEIKGSLKLFNPGLTILGEEIVYL